MKEIKLQSSDNITIAANYYEKGGRCSVVIICPGCFMSKDARPFLNLSEDIFKEMDVITMDFRGHGRSSGLFSFTAKEKDDLKAVVDFAGGIYPKIHLLGFSLGAATAIIYAAFHKNIESILAVSAPSDFNKIENRFWESDAVMPAIKKFEPGKSPTIRPGNIFLEKIKPIDVVSQLAPIPIMFMSGSKDPIVFAYHSEELFKKAQEPKELEIVKEGIHAEELYIQDPDWFVNICLDWMKGVS